MHIVHVIARLNDGGPARVLASLAKTLGARGHRLTILAGTCAADERDLTEYLRADGVMVETISGLGRRVSPWSDVQAFVAIRRRLRELKPDVVHTHTAKAGVLGRLACSGLRLPCLHTYHGHVLSGYFDWFGSLLARWIEQFCAGAHHHQALTASQLCELRDRYRIGRADRWHELPIPVERVEIRPAVWQDWLAKDRPVIGFLGRLAPVKDITLWLDTLALIAEQIPVQGVVCGDGAERMAAEVRARHLSIPIRFTGFVPAGELFQVCDVLLITSRNEGLPLSAVEAGGVIGRDPVPVVAPAVGGLADLITAEAVIGAERTPAALAAAVIACLRTRLAAPRAASYAAALEPSVLADRYEALYRSIACAGPA